MKRHAPAAERNKQPIADALAEILPPAGTVLEVASGSGQHAVFLARTFPDLTWQPSEVDPDGLASIEAHVAEANLANLRAPIALDAADDWPALEVDAVWNANMIHIARWEACLGLMKGAAAALASGGVLAMYGPYFQDDVPTAPSNVAFDQSLRGRDPRWGVRRLEDVRTVAASHGLDLERVIPMPANNLIVAYRRA